MNPGCEYNKAIRLIWIREVLPRRPMTAREMAKILATSQRTIVRDLLDLQTAPSPLRMPLVLDTSDGWRWKVEQ